MGSTVSNTEPAFIAGNLVVTHDLGSTGHPVLLVIDGSLDLQDNARITGLVVLLHDWDNSMQAGSIRGSVIVDGNVSFDGIVSFNYDQAVLASVQQSTGYFYPVAGAWHDRRPLALARFYDSRQPHSRDQFADGKSEGKDAL